MTYSRHFCATMLDHYQHLLKSADSEEQETVIRRNIRLYKTQLKQHESAHMHTKPHHPDLLVHYYPAPEGLTYQERKAHQLLSQVNRKTLIGCGIGVALADGTVSKFRQLIRELQDQIRDCPIVMMGILGKECYEAVYKIGFADVSL